MPALIIFLRIASNLQNINVSCYFTNTSVVPDTFLAAETCALHSQVLRNPIQYTTNNFTAQKLKWS